MKILHITKGSEGGLENISKRIFLDAKSKKMHQKIIYFYNYGDKFYREFKKEKLRPFDFKEEVFFVNLFKNFKDLKKADLIHVHHVKTWILFSYLFLYKNKIIYSLHGNFGSDLKKNFLIKLIISFIINYIAIFSKRLIFLNNAQKENLNRYALFKKSLEKKSIIINNFIEKKRIIKNKKKFNNKVLFVGRYTKLKGFEDLIKLAKDTRDINFYLIGNNSFKSNIPNLKNLGKIDNSKIFREYDKYSILILPSYTESWGLVILEAMSRGLVVLASNLSAIKEYFKEGRNGYLFPPGDTEKMKELILYLKNNPKEIERISKNNLKDIHKFTAEKQVPKYLKFYKEVLNEK